MKTHDQALKRNAKSDEEMFILAQRNNEQGHPTSIFGKYLSRKAIWDLEFSEHLLYSLACLPLLGFSSIQKMVKLPVFNGFYPKKVT